MAGEIPVQPYTEGRAWHNPTCTHQTLPPHSMTHNFKRGHDKALRKHDPSPIVIKIMNLLVAAKLIIFKKYFFLYVLKCVIPGMTITFGDFSFYIFVSKNHLNFLKFQELVKVY